VDAGFEGSAGAAAVGEGAGSEIVEGEVVGAFADEFADGAVGEGWGVGGGHWKSREGRCAATEEFRSLKRALLQRFQGDRAEVHYGYA
jgi:hypothetical protein